MSAHTGLLGTLGLTLALLTLGCAQEAPIHARRLEAFGTTVDLSIVGMDDERASKVSARISQDLRELDAAWNAWEPGPLAYLNERLPTHKPFAAPPVLLPLIHAAERLARESDQRFNPAMGKLMALWGFHSDPPDCKPPPPTRQIDRLVKANPRLSDISQEGILLKGNNSELQLDFGAFAKGFAMDLAIARMRELGVRNALINAGGDVRVIGTRSGLPWRIPIRRGTGNGVLAIIELRGDESLFTAATYQRSYVYEGKTYHHLIDPRTGYPAGGTQSVTLVHQEAATAAAAATALFLAGPESWQPIAQGMGITQVLLVDTAGTLHMSPLMAKRVQLLEKSAPIELSAPLTDPKPAR